MRGYEQFAPSSLEARQRAEAKEWFGQEECDWCGEVLKGIHDEVGEFYDPKNSTANVNDHKIGHAQCGIDAGWETA